LHSGAPDPGSQPRGCMANSQALFSRASVGAKIPSSGSAEGILSASWAADEWPPGARAGTSGRGASDHTD